MRSSTMFLLLVVMQLVVVSPARAFIGCADTVAGIEFGLAAAEDNDQDDEIRVVAGAYDLTQGLSYLSGEPHSLKISGGWNGDCSVQGAGATMLDAHGLDQVLRIRKTACF